jgi:hypothetical protein
MMQLTNRTLAVATRAALVAALTLTLHAGVSRAGDSDAPAAEGDGPECTNHTLRGDFGFTIDGSVLAGPSPVIVRAVAMTHFDGDGHLTQVDFATFNGVPGFADWRPATGTYSINPDCTGRALIVPVVGPPLDLRLIVFDGGRQVASVVVGNATGSLGVKR